MNGRNDSIRGRRDFLIVWLGQTISTFGSRLTYVALYWWILDTTGSTGLLATVATISAIPALLLGPVAGALVDRLDRRRLMLLIDLVNAVLVTCVATLLFVGRLQVWHVLVINPLTAATMIFHRPALQASIPNLVSKGQLTQANSLHQISNSVVSIAGWGLAGLLVGWIGSGPTMWVDAATFLVAGGTLLMARFASPCRCDGQGPAAVLRDTWTGLRYLARERVLLCLVLLFALINFILAPTAILFPVMAKDILGAGAEGFGALNSAVSFGMLIGGLFTASLKHVRRHGLWILGALVVVGLCLAAFGVSRKLVVSLGLLAVVGVGVVIVNVFESVVFQTRVPNELQGRVFAAQEAVCNSLQPLSLAITGGLLVILSAPTLIIITGVSVALAGLAAVGMRELRSL